jgi:hypothetical protein
MLKLVTKEEFDKVSMIGSGLQAEIRKMNDEIHLKVGDVIRVEPRDGESTTRLSNRVSAAFRNQGFSVTMRCRKGMGCALATITEAPSSNG